MTTTAEATVQGVRVPATMRAMVVRQYGGPEVLRMEEVPVPQPGPGEVLLRVGAVTVNRTFDLKVRQDGYDGRNPPPIVLGADPSGEVVAVGPGVRAFQVDDRAAVWRAHTCGACEGCLNGDLDRCRRRETIGLNRWGGYAEYVAAPTSTLHPIPDSLPYPIASVVIRHYPKALAQAIDRAGLRMGESVLVMGAAGALGSALIQVARKAGARVLAGAGADERVAAALANGAHAGVNYRRQDLTAEAKRFTNGRGVDVVFENIGDPTLWPAAMASLRWGGRLATTGAHGGGVVPLAIFPLYAGLITILGGATARPEHVQQAFEGAVEGAFHASIGLVLPLEEAARAHRLVAEGAVIGKVILQPQSDA